MGVFTRFLLSFLIVFGGTAHAQESEWVKADYVDARLISAITAIGPEAGEFSAGLELRLQEGWHSYWRMPGEGGLPPRFDWTGSKNVKDVAIEWPVPWRIETFGLYSFGYKDQVILPLTVSLEESGAAAQVDLSADIMVCKDICVPQKVILHMEIAAGEAEDTTYKRQIDWTVSKLAVKGDIPALKIERLVLGPDALVINAFSQNRFEKADLYVEAGEDYIVAPPEITANEDDPRYAVIRVAAPESVDNLATALMNQTVTLTLIDGQKAIEKSFSF